MKNENQQQRNNFEAFRQRNQAAAWSNLCTHWQIGSDEKQIGKISSIKTSYPKFRQNNNQLIKIKEAIQIKNMNKPKLCPSCEKILINDENYTTIARCKNSQCTEFNVPISVR